MTIDLKKTDVSSWGSGRWAALLRLPLGASRDQVVCWRGFVAHSARLRPRCCATISAAGRRWPPRKRSSEFLPSAECIAGPYSPRCRFIHDEIAGTAYVGAYWARVGGSIRGFHKGVSETTRAYDGVSRVPKGSTVEDCPSGLRRSSVLRQGQLKSASGQPATGRRCHRPAGNILRVRAQCRG